MKRIDFIFQEYKNIKARKTNSYNQKQIFKNYIVETLSKKISLKDRKIIYKIYKKI